MEVGGIRGTATMVRGAECNAGQPLAERGRCRSMTSDEASAGQPFRDHRRYFSEPTFERQVQIEAVNLLEGTSKNSDLREFVRI
jgi:hypothetical protein